jgi:phosphoribosylformylglycinamidine cyclo-ligase
MLRVFNCGLGMVLVVAEADADPAILALQAGGVTAHRIGLLEAASGEAPGEATVRMRGHLAL